MAPEQARSPHDVDARADIYSLGATLYRLLTGVTPVEAHGVVTRKEALAAVLDDRPSPPVASLNPEVPADLARLIDRMVSRRRDERPGTMEEVARELGPFARGGAADGPGVATPEPVPISPAERPRTRRWRRPTTADTLTLLTLSVIVALWRAPWRPQSPVPGNDPDSRVARHAIGMGGRLTVMKKGADDESEDITNLEQLRGSKFVIREIFLQNNVDANDAFLEEVSNLRELKYLELLDARNVTDRGVAHLARCRSLMKLDLKGTGVTDEALRTVGSLPGLVTLKLSNTRVSDVNLKLLMSLKSLQQLYLSNTRITNQGMKSLAGLESLTVLDLHDNKTIDDQGLALLPAISIIHVGSTAITAEGICRFECLHPGCHVTTEPPH